MISTNKRRYFRNVQKSLLFYTKLYSCSDVCLYFQCGTLKDHCDLSGHNVIIIYVSFGELKILDYYVFHKINTDRQQSENKNYYYFKQLTRFHGTIRVYDVLDQQSNGHGYREAENQTCWHELAAVVEPLKKGEKFSLVKLKYNLKEKR